MKSDRAPGLGMWLWWVVASGLGFVGTPLQPLAQWLVLRRHISRAGWWVLATILGMAVGGAVGMATGVSRNVALAWAVGDGSEVVRTGATLGAAVGVAQWLVLRQHFAQAGWWIPASIAGWTVGAVAGLSFVGDCAEFGRCFAGWVANGALTGAVTGLMLLWMSRPISQPRQSEADTQLAGKETKSST